MITFKQQFDKLTEAYIRGEVNPNSPCACFVGNLLNRSTMWSNGRIYTMLINERLEPSLCRPLSYDHLNSVIESIKHHSEGLYTLDEILSLEQRFMISYLDGGGSEKDDPIYDADIDSESVFIKPINEDALFVAFEKTLELLKQIHESKGEIVEPFEFTKRQPQNELI